MRQNTSVTNRSSSSENFSLQVDVQETDAQYVLQAQIPNMNAEDIHIRIEDNCIILEGMKEDSSQLDSDGFFSESYSSNHFYRLIPLEASVDPDDVHADFDEEVLTITVGKNERAPHETREIPIITH
jgi:HSP20 family protein